MLARYTGGNTGWGTLVYTCEICGEDIAEYEVDEYGRPVKALWDETESHVCPDPD